MQPIYRALWGDSDAAAFILGDRLNKEVIDNVFQANEVSHTAASSSGLLLGQPPFAGVVSPGARALILDDVVTLGCPSAGKFDCNCIVSL